MCLRRARGTINISRRCHGKHRSLQTPPTEHPRSTPCPVGCKHWEGAVPNVLTRADGNRRVITKSLRDGFFLFSTLSSFFPFFLRVSHTLSPSPSPTFLPLYFSPLVFLFFHKPFPPLHRHPNGIIYNKLFHHNCFETHLVHTKA